MCTITVSLFCFTCAFHSSHFSSLKFVILLQRIAKSYLPVALHDDHLQWQNVPNHVSRALGDAWLAVEYCIALLSTKSDYRRSINEMSSWVSPIVCRILVPDEKNDNIYQQSIRLIDEFGGPPEWDESLEYIEMLQEAFCDPNFCPVSERNFRLDEDTNHVIISARPNADQNEKAGCSWNELRIYCDEMTQPGASSGFSPARKVYTCHVCREPGDGFCWSSNVGAIQSYCFVHPKCVLQCSMAGPLKCLRGESESPNFPSALHERFRALFDIRKMDYDTKMATERQEFISLIVGRHDANVFLDDSHQSSREGHMKLSKLKRIMMRLGIFDEIIQFLKVPLPQKFDRSDAKDYNAKMQRRMQIRRINFRFDTVSETVEKIVIAENLFHRMFYFLALAAEDSRLIQNLFQSEVHFFISRALNSSALTSTGIFLCLQNIMNGRLDLASNISFGLLEQTILSALDGQFPAKLLLLRSFLIQDGKNLPLNQLKTLDVCLPSSIINGGRCFFTLDNDFPVEIRNKANFEKWRLHLLSSHSLVNLRLGQDSAHYGEICWKNDENWRHLLRISSDIVHGGYAAKSQPCASAFHLAVIRTLTDCTLNNIDTVSGVLLYFFCLLLSFFFRDKNCRLGFLFCTLFMY
jgi:hypothetical protein